MFLSLIWEICNFEIVEKLAIFMEAVKKTQLKTMMFVLIGFIVFFICVIISTLVWAKTYDEKIAPNVSIGPVIVGGLTQKEAQALVQQQIDKLMTTGLIVENLGTKKTLSLSTGDGTDLRDLVTFDLSSALAEATLVNHHATNSAINTWLLLNSFRRQTYIPLTVSFSKEAIQSSVYTLFPTTEVLPKNASFIIQPTESGPMVEVSPAQSGKVFVWDVFFQELESALATLQPQTIPLTLKDQNPEITTELAQSQTGQAEYALIFLFPQSFIFTDTDGQEQSRPLGGAELFHLKNLLIPTIHGLSIDETGFNTFLDPIAQTIDKPAQNARFQVVDGRVIDFAGSKKGTRLDRRAARDELIARINTTDPDIATSFALKTQAEEPSIKTEDVNSLGVTGVLGVGTSSYRGSPQNRRKNIQNGVNLLNGILIPPGVTFSLLSALQPFETENGYLPELVIKGNKITPELGGGLCQIGTTTFRAAMNSGMPIVERQNHSLVVSYYNDPSNKNPGTDATIYEPAPDFKFLNDTNSYLLFQAENFTDTQELRFTLWGTSDGRKGFYTPPTVVRWIPVGETQSTETTDLEPGKEKCQDAHIGADTMFDYTIVRPNGISDITTFTSHYRPLPRLCLIGVEKLSTEILPTGTTAPEPTSVSIP